MTETTDELIQQAIEKAKAGNKADAKRILSLVVKDNPESAQAWYLLSQLVDEREQIEYCLEKAIAADPLHVKAARRLQQLQGEDKQQRATPPPVAPPPAAQQPTKKRSNLGMIALVIFAVACLICVSIPGIPFMMALLGVGTPSTTQEPLTQNIQPTISNSTAPPEQRLLAPSCQEIKEQTKDQTDVQWEKYKEDIKGKWIVDWEGEITQVGGESMFSDGYSVHLSTPDGCSILFDLADQNQALSYTKGQRLTITGQVSMLADILGKVIYLEDSTVEVKDVQQ